MFRNIRKKGSKALNTRIVLLLIVVILMAALLLQRLFYLQIVQGETYQNNFFLSIRKERTLKSSRGSIYDRNGKPIAYNELSYCVTFEDNGSYSSTHEKNLALNSTLYHVIKIVEEQGDSVIDSFKIALSDDGTWEYTASGFTLNRFKADIFGQAYINDLSSEELNMSAEDLMALLCGVKYYGILDPKITAAERKQYDLPDSYTDKELLQLVTLRAAIAAYSFQRYQSVTIAKDVSEETVARIMENAASFQGIDISEEYRRVYADAEYIAPLIGYTGQISAEELESLSEKNDSYDATDIVGKTGLESVLETTLQGDKGSEVLYVDNVGRTLEVESRVEPQAGSDVYLTIDLDLQKAAYQILEQYIAGIVWSKIIDAEEFDADAVESADQLLIPVYDVYYALFENNVLDVGHLKADDATENEKAVYNAFLIKASEIFATLKDQLLTNDPVPYKDLEEQYQIYESYIVNDMLMNDTGILNEDAIDKSDPVYEQWTEEESISLKEFLTYAISQNWIDVTKITDGSEYMDTEEVFTALSDYIASYLYDDNNFCKQVYRYMLKEKRLNGDNICMLLFDQGVLEMDTDTYNGLSAGSIDDCEFIRQKIYNLEIRPSQLALAPCSGSLVLTDPNSGETLACVTYPGYDNNRLANEMDSDYFTKLNMDKSSPFYSRATQEAIAPGSTFKIVTATAGYMEGVINIGEGINCTGKFDIPPFDEQPINCWNIYGHGVETLQTAIRDSCNYFFNSVAYRLSLVNGEYVDSVGIEKLTKYASMYGLDAKSGLEVPETMPSISTEDAARSAMGQSTHLFTTAGLARYVSTIANSGTCYDLTLVKYITDSSGSVLKENKATVHNTLDLPQELWDTIHAGMRGVVQNHSAFSAQAAPAFNGSTGLAVAGKTGTAQQSKDKPNHGLFIGYAPYDDPEIALAVRITNGYSSANAALVARDVISYYYKLQDESELITGHASQPSESGTAFAD